MKPTSLDELISKKAAEFADQVRAAAAIADKEEEIRIAVERQLAFVEREAGVKLEGKHEFTVASGRTDSVMLKSSSTRRYSCRRRIGRRTRFWRSISWSWSIRRYNQ
jgi:hypothetical protein